MYDHGFEAPIERFGVGKVRKLWYNVLFMPLDLAATLPFARHPRRRVGGEIADVPVAGAWMPSGHGRRYYIVAPRVLKDAGVDAGDRVEMRFAIADQDAVEMPEELERALAADRAARAALGALTAGKQRGITHRIHGAKGAATRARRVADVISELTGAG